MSKQNTKDNQKKEIEDLLSKSAALRAQHQNTSERMDEIRRRTEHFLQAGEDDTQSEEKINPNS